MEGKRVGEIFSAQWKWTSSLWDTYEITMMLSLDDELENRLWEKWDSQNVLNVTVERKSVKHAEEKVE